MLSARRGNGARMVPATPMIRRVLRSLAVVSTVAFVSGCQILSDMERLGAQNDLRAIRRWNLVVPALVLLAIATRLTGHVRPNAKKMATGLGFVIASVHLVVTLAAILVAPETSPRSISWVPLYAAAWVVTLALALDAATARSRHLRRVALGLGLALCGTLAVVSAPRASGRIVDVIELRHGICVGYERGGFWCPSDTRPHARRDVPDGRVLEADDRLCGLVDGRLACAGEPVRHGVTAAAARHGEIVFVQDGVFRTTKRKRSGRGPCPDRRVGPAVALTFGSHDATLDRVCVLRPAGTVSCWGGGAISTVNYEGPALDPLVDQSLSSDLVVCPATIDIADKRIRMISGGDGYTCALDDAGRVWCWGRNDAHELGRETMHPADDTPSTVAVPPPIVAIASAGSRTCAQTVDGQVWCWGAHNRVQRLALPPIERLLFVYGTPCALTAAAPAGELFCDGWVTPGYRGLHGMRYTVEEVPYPTGPTWIPL